MGERIMKYVHAVGGMNNFVWQVDNYQLPVEIVAEIKAYKRKRENQGIPDRLHRLLMNIMYI